MQPRYDAAGNDLVRTLAPTMLIGIGGTGTEALLRVRRLFFERYGHTGFPIVGYLALDTNKNAFGQLKGEASDLVLRNIRFKQAADIPESIDCSITQQEFEQYFTGRERQHPHIFRWMLGEMDRYGGASIVEGAGQNRLFGRLGFFHHFATIRETLRNRINKIRDEAVLPHRVLEWLPRDAEVDRNRLDVVVIYSLAGGTGAGMFLDVGMLARHVVQRDLRLDVQPRFTHYAVLPETFVNRVPLDDDMRSKIQENAFTCLREMEYFSMKRSSASGAQEEQSFDLSIPPPLPLEDAEPKTNEPLYRVQWERGGEEYEIRDAPWNTCYLVGGGNDPMNAAFLSPGEVTQMIAERLFLDFDPSQFGGARRPLDSNLQQGLLSRMPISVPNDQGDELYRYYVSRRFSIFGLSQLYFDRTRMRRAASFRLAERLIQRWLRPSGLVPSVVHQFAQQDLAGGTSGAKRVVTETQETDDPLLAISYDALRDQILLEDREHDAQRSYWSKLQAQFAELRRSIEDGAIDPRSATTLEKLLREHEPPLERPPAGEPGIALRTYRRNRDTLVREIEQRLRCLFLYRLRQHGVPGALQLFSEYNTLNQAELQRAQANQKSPPALGSEWSDRLRDACKVPWPFTRPAARIELLRGATQVHRHIAQAYHYGAVSDIRACLERTQRCISLKEEQEGSYASVLRRFQTALDSPNDRHPGVRQLLHAIFDQLSKPDTSHSRTIGLLARWEEHEKVRHYDDNIDKLLSSDGDARNIDWTDIEMKILGALRASGKERWLEVKHLGDLALNLVRLDSTEPVSPVRIDEFTRDLAEACESLLKGFVRSISALDRFNGESEQRDKDSFLDSLRLYSAPFLRKSDDVSLPRDGVKSTLAMLGMANSGGSGARQFRDKLVETGGPRDTALKNLENFDTQDDTIVLYQERVGVPLCYYAGLDEIGRLFDRSKRKKETYFDFPALRGKLPEVRKINQRKELAACVEPILLGIMSGVLAYERDNFWLSIRHGHGDAMRRPLGGQFEDVIKHCGSNRQILEELQRQFQAWRERVAGRDDGTQLALLWCATQDLKERIRARVQGHLNRDHDVDRLELSDHPLLAILGKTLSKLRRWLEGLSNGSGSRWLNSVLDLDAIVNDPELDEDEKDRRLRDRDSMLEGCYSPSALDPVRMPIPVINADGRINDFSANFETPTRRYPAKEEKI